MGALLNIGATQGAMREARAAILDILTARADQETIRVALDTLRHIAEVHNVSISGCYFDGALSSPQPRATFKAGADDEEDDS